MSESESGDNGRRKAFVEGIGLKYLGIPAVDEEGYPITLCLPKIERFLGITKTSKTSQTPSIPPSLSTDGRPTSVLVHCMAGVNRSVSAAILLLCILEVMSIALLAFQLWRTNRNMFPVYILIRARAF